MFTNPEQFTFHSGTTSKYMRRVALYLGLGSATSILFSIALSQILLGLALLAIFASRLPVRFPPIKLPLALFVGQTVLALLCSGHVLAGLPQIRKFFVFGILLVVATVFESLQHVKVLCLAWCGVAGISAVFALIQYFHRDRDAHTIGAADDYGFYLDSRLVGLASHWMTFGGELMIVFVMALSFVLFAEPTKWRWPVSCSLLLLWVVLLLGLTRCVFLIGVPAGATYLLWIRKRWIVAIVPLVVALVLWKAPFQVRERIGSVTAPHGTVDSNVRRVILSRTGLAMIKAHPLLGLGPEQVGAQFLKYVPSDIPRPLPKGWYGHLHNIYLQYAAERGIPELLFMLAFLGKIVFDLRREIDNSSNREGTWVLHGVVAVTCSILAEGLFEHNLGDSEVLTMFLSVVGCGYVVVWQHQRSRRFQVSEVSFGQHAPAY
jgi:putative inorganic carbon (hco3(-)) transporter